MSSLVGLAMIAKTIRGGGIWTPVVGAIGAVNLIDRLTQVEHLENGDRNGTT